MLVGLIEKGRYGRPAAATASSLTIKSFPYDRIPENKGGFVLVFPSICNTAISSKLFVATIFCNEELVLTIRAEYWNRVGWSSATNVATSTLQLLRP
jgi:hypothetical protein